MGVNKAGSKKIIRIKDESGNSSKLEIWHPQMEQVEDGECYQITNLKVYTL
jgi:hypothetical protein